MRRSLLIALTLSLLLSIIVWPAAIVSAAPPVKEKQFVYSISPWTGKEYGGTFAAKNMDTIYLMSDVQNILNPLKTEVYFWEITSEYMADWYGYKEEVPGKLEILKDGKVIETLEKIKYAYSYPNGYYGGGMKLVTGEEAEAEYQRYKAALDKYWDEVSAYYEAQAEYNAKMDELLKRVSETGEAAKPEEIPQPPAQPVPPKLYVTQPAESFVFELPEGQYTIRLIDESGNVVPESEKKLITFGPRRQGAGYEIIPESKWTMPVVSDDISQTMYIQGKTIMYLKPFDEKEFNTFKYIRMTQLHKPLAGQGTESSWMWVHTEELKGVKAQVVKDGKVISEVEEKPYYVKQTPGYALGYDIIEFNPKDPEMQGRQPSFTAFKFELDNLGSYQIQLIDSSGKVIPGSVRNVMPIKSTSSTWLLILALFPVVIGLVAWSWRRSLRPRKVQERAI